MPLPTPNAQVQRGDAGPALIPITAPTRDNPSHQHVTTSYVHKGWDASDASFSPATPKGSAVNLRQEEAEGISPLPPHQGTESQLCQQEEGYFRARDIFPPPVSCQGASHPIFKFWKARINLLPAVTVKSPSSSCLLRAHPGLLATRLLLMLRCNSR